MRSEELTDISKKATSALSSFENWDIKDQLEYVIVLEKFLAEIKPIIEKYDITDGFKLKIERLFGS